MTPQQIDLVKASWAKVLPIKNTAGRLFYDKLFQIDPALKALFTEDLNTQIDKLMATLNLVVTSLDHLDTVLPQVEDLGRRHVGYGVKDQDYDAVGQALLWTLGQGLGSGFTSVVKEAWVEAYTILSSTMKAAARHVALE